MPGVNNRPYTQGLGQQQRRYCRQGCGTEVKQRDGRCRNRYGNCQAATTGTPWGWRERAACFNTRDPRVFPTVDGQSVRVAEARQQFIDEFCGNCETRVECRREAEALATDIRRYMCGVWDGVDWPRRQVNGRAELLSEWRVRVGWTEED